MADALPSLNAETQALLALHLVDGLGPRLTKALLERFGSAVGVLRASAHELQSVPLIGAKTASNFVAAMRSANVDKELELLDKHHVQLLRFGTPDYPASLVTIHDPPHLLYMRGMLKAEDGNAVALVGSRNCSAYGRRLTERLAGDLARAGFTIVSGLARGIDGIAHRTALEAGGRTLAVMAGGLSKIYPPEHEELAERVTQAGALLSETAMGLAPMAGMFPARNRLISGLSKGIIVVEAAERSGALITASHAAEQGRDVFAVPGPVDSETSGGALGLLRQGAILIRGAEDVLEALGATPTKSPSKPKAPPPIPDWLTDNQRKLFAAISADPIHADVLVQQIGLPVVEVGSALLTMEMRGLIRRLPGNRYERK